jgi:hypothetical protein
MEIGELVLPKSALTQLSPHPTQHSALCFLNSAHLIPLPTQPFHALSQKKTERHNKISPRRLPQMGAYAPQTPLAEISWSPPFAIFQRDWVGKGLSWETGGLGKGWVEGTKGWDGLSWWKKGLRWGGLSWKRADIINGDPQADDG